VIDDKTDVMTDFYNAKQMSDENVATWSCRLEEILGKAILIGKVKKAESDDMLPKSSSTSRLLSLFNHF
jgi:hypothetical protein